MKRRATSVWRRRVAVRPRGGYRAPAVLLSGPDAPLSERGAKVWHLIVAAVVVLGVVLIVAAFLSR